MIKIKIACCGDDCSFCPRYFTNLSNDKEKLKEIALLWKKIGWRNDINPLESLICHGCQTFIDQCEYNIRECCLEKKIQNCGKCDFYPCDKVENAFKITKLNTVKFKTILSNKQYDIFTKAYFLKKENLDKIKKDIKKKD